MRRRREAGFADADPEARQHELQEVLRQSADGGHGTPQRHGSGDDVNATAAVGYARDGDAEGCVQCRECEPGDHTQLPVRQTEIRLDGFDEDVDDLPVDEVREIQGDQHAEDVVAACVGDRHGCGPNDLLVE